MIIVYDKEDNLISGNDRDNNYNIIKDNINSKTNNAKRNYIKQKDTRIIDLEKQGTKIILIIMKYQQRREQD